MFYYVYFDDPNNIGHDSLDVLEIVWETANCRFVSGPHNRVQTNLKSNENYYNYLTSCGFFSWHFFRFFWKFKPYHYLGIFPQRKATPVHTVKLRDVDRSTIQFCTLLAKDFTVSVCPWPNGLKIRLIIKISTHPCYPRNFDCFSWGWSRKKNWKKKSKLYD